MYALTGNVAHDMNDPIGKDKDGKDVFLKDIWFDSKELEELQ